MLKAIIFDMDGTLADTEDIHRLAFNQAFSEFQMDWQWSVEEYKQLLSISGGRERIRIYLRQREYVPKQNMDLWHLAKSVHKRKSDIYREMLVGGGIRLRSGVQRLIDDAVNSKITLAIATSSCRKNVETLLTSTLGGDALELFPVIVTSDIVEDKKPSPAVYQLCLAKLGMEPENCVAIEDTYNGNQAALRAQLKTVITTHVYTIDDDFSGASLVTDELGEPHQPFTVIAGNAYARHYVDIELLRMMCRDKPAETASSEWEPGQKAFAAT